MNATKMIVVEMPDRSEWAVPAEVVAHNRADFYREDGYKEEFDYAMSDASELLDWAANEMNWSDVEKYAVLLELPKPPNDEEKQEAWINGEKRVLPVPKGMTIKVPEFE